MHVLADLKTVLPYRFTRQVRIHKRTLFLRCLSSTKAREAFERITDDTDVDRIRRLWIEMQPAFKADAGSAAKYPDFEVWLRLNIYNAVTLGLDRKRSLNILDLGCGPGYFLKVARYFGHECFGIDAPGWYLSPIERRVFPEMLEALRCRDFVRHSLIQRFVPLQINRTFDLITAFWVCFNNHLREDEWGVKEWEFFIQDSMQHLSPGGMLYLELNENRMRYGQRRWYDAETLAYFESVGDVRRQSVTVVRSNA
jgi:SAM-dependent methyltransferase